MRTIASAEFKIHISSLPPENRGRAAWILDEGFSGLYRMHAKYILKRADIALLATIDGNDAGLILVDRITSTMGYVFYIAVSRAYRRQGIGGALLDRAIGIMEEEGMKDIYAVRDEENMAAERLFGSRLFKGVSLHEFSKNYGFWQSRRLRRRMTMVFGETMMRRVID